MVSNVVPETGKRLPLARLATGFRRRHLVIAPVFGLHILLLALVAFSSPATPQGAVQPRPIATFDVAVVRSSPPPAAPEVEPVETPIPPPIVQLEVEQAELPVFSAAAAELAGFGTSCEITDALARAFLADPKLLGQLSMISPESRSVANAIMFWDKVWVDPPGEVSKEALGTLRRAVTEAVEAAPPECLLQEIQGPRFISIREESHTTVLVLGSGRWRLAEILEAEPSGEKVKALQPEPHARPTRGGELK